MKFAKRVLALLSAVVFCGSLAAGAFAEKIVEDYKDAGGDKALADGYRELFQYKTITEEGFSITLPYRLYVPEDYDVNYAYPVILFLHGAGESGGDNEKQLNVGMMTPFFEKGYYEKFPCIIVAAQVPGNPENAIGEWVNTSWKSGSYEIKDMDKTGPTFTEEIQLAKKAVDQTVTEYNVDTNRIYVTGISMGGYGTWNIITHYSDFFAAAMPICGAGDPSKAEYLMNMPIWCFHGDQDTAVPVAGSRDMYDAITALGSTKINYTEWAGGGHAWLPAYNREDVWRWLFSQSKNTVDVTELQSRFDQLKAMDTSVFTAEQLEKYNYAVAFVDMIINDPVHTEATVTKATSLADEVLAFSPAQGTGMTLWSIILIAVIGGVLIVAGVVVLVVLVLQKKA